MNSLERVMAAVGGKPSDRPAVAPLLSLYGARLTGSSLREHYTNPNTYVSGQSAVRETFQPDLLFSPFILPLEGEAFGSEIAFFDDQAPNLARPAVGSAQEAINLNIPDIDSHPRLLFVREAVRLLAAQHGKEVPIVGIVLDPATLPIMIMGIDAWLETLLFDEKTTKLVLDKTKEFFVKWANALLADGATMLALPVMFNPEVVTPKIVKDIAVPVYEETFKEVNGPIVIHPAGSYFLPFLEYYTSLPNVAGFVLDSRDSFSEAREKVGPDKVLLGNIAGPSLCKQSVEEVECQCAGILADRSDDMHFILATSRADVAYDTPAENIHAMIEAASKYGRRA